MKKLSLALIFVLFLTGPTMAVSLLYPAQVNMLFIGIALISLARFLRVLNRNIVRKRKNKSIVKPYKTVLN